MTFQFEKLEVYQKSLNWVESADQVCSNAKGKIAHSTLDQLSRASISIPLNIAEGNGRWHKGDKRQFFWIARGSVFECVPLIQVLKRKMAIEEKDYLRYYEQLETLSKMLTGLVNSIEELREKD